MKMEQNFETSNNYTLAEKIYLIGVKVSSTLLVSHISFMIEIKVACALF